MKIGFLINPIAGIGGPLGLGGTDAIDDVILRRSKHVSKGRARIAVLSISHQPGFGDMRFMTCSGEMGSELLTESGVEHEVIYRYRGRSTGEDTRKACSEFLSREIDILLFAGGDGTVKDIFSVIGKKISVLGIPAGVKMHSSVFLNKPEEAGAALISYFESGKTLDGDILDVDEEAFREGKISVRFLGTALLPDTSGRIQPNKSPSDPADERDSVRELSDYFAQAMDPEVLYILGTGSTVSAISRKLGIDRNDLAVSAVIGGKEIGSRLDEAGILRLIRDHPDFRIVVTPIGGQGFIFGRGNQQISSEVIQKAGRDNIVIVSNPGKLARLTVIRADTGSSETDELLRGYWKVLTGYGKYRAAELMQ